MNYQKRGIVGRGKAVHALYVSKDGVYKSAACGANNCSTGFRRRSFIIPISDQSTITCTRCLNIVAHYQKLEDQRERDEQEAYWDSFVD